ncbi:hypothetical protein PtB15_2B205 [Puccinia triticina]|nr:hypothetical protein PtB15_2B205 [Puccinia triticina]
MNFAGMTNGTSAAINMDPYEAGWKDEEEVIQDAVGFRSSMGTLRQVCWWFFRLATPLFLKRLVIWDANWGHRPLDLILRLSKLLGATPAHASVTGKEQPAIRQHLGSQVPYGHHVRQLIFSNRTIPPRLVCQLLETIHSLLPNLTALGGLSLSHMPRLLSPAIRFPRLVSITGIDLAASSELWTAGQDHPADFVETPTLMAGLNQFISQEVFLGILNHHPHISYLSCRGLQIDEAGANLLSALLRANSRSHSPDLQQLHINAGCKLEDKSTDSSLAWSMSELLGMLPRLTHLTFIAQRNLPSRHGSLGWASSNEVLRFSPCVQSLNLRMDSFTTANFFDSLNDDSMTLRQLNVWHRPTLNLNPASESWSIISFDSPQKLLNETEGPETSPPQANDDQNAVNVQSEPIKAEP